MISSKNAPRSGALAAPVELRPAHEVMTLERMGSFHQSRLSFMRILLRRMKSECWRFDRPRFEINGSGEGVAVYSAHGPERSYSLVAFAHDLPAEKRSDRVIAEAWDATFTLFDGVPGQADIDRLARNVPVQEAGRVTERELSLSRANRSVRLWDYVTECLAKGEQPDASRIEDVGYLMRTTAVYGSGKFGAADREAICDRPEFRAPFQVEMLNVFLVRAFVVDLVEAMARHRSPDTAVALAPAVKRRLGIGNSTGLGMAPFLINHPMLLNNWVYAREKAFAHVRALPAATPQEIAAFQDFTRRAAVNADNWRSEHPVQKTKLAKLRADMGQLVGYLTGFNWDGPQPWNALWQWVRDTLSLEGQEQVVSLFLEVRPQVADELANHMSADEDFRIDGTIPLQEFRKQVEETYAWALEIDWECREARARVWYTSAEKLEPRLGERFEEDLEPYEQALAPGRDAARLHGDLSGASEASLGAFLMRYPQHRHIVRRVQITAGRPYAEIRSNTIAADMMPIDLLRAKLSFFGAGHFDPRSDRWVRINMFKNAPYPPELKHSDPDDWAFPSLVATEQ